MAGDVYILPIDTGTATLEIALASGITGYSQVSYDDGGTVHLLASDPAADPPVGELPYDDGGTIFHVPFVLAQVEGLWERSANAARSIADFVFTDVVPLAVEYDNGPSIIGQPNADAPDVLVSVEFAKTEPIGFGTTVLVRATGEMVIRFRAALQRGDDDVLSIVESVKPFFRGQRSGILRTFDPYHVVTSRNGPYHEVQLRVPFQSQDEFDRAPSDPPSGVMTLGVAHDAIRSRLNDYVAVPESIPFVWDNFAHDPAGAALWCRASIVQGVSRIVGHGRSKRRRYVGVVKVAICRKLGRGMKQSWRTADAIASATHAASRMGVRFGIASARSLGRRGKNWFVVVDVPFTFDEIA